jgi:hypothetical protein
VSRRCGVRVTRGTAVVRRELKSSKSDDLRPQPLYNPNPHYHILHKHRGRCETPEGTGWLKVRLLRCWWCLESSSSRPNNTPFSSERVRRPPPSLLLATPPHHHHAPKHIMATTAPATPVEEEAAALDLDLLVLDPPHPPRPLRPLLFESPRPRPGGRRR